MDLIAAWPWLLAGLGAFLGLSAFKMSGALFRSAAADGTGRRMDAQGRRQDLKTPVEQALMRGLDTA